MSENFKGITYQCFGNPSCPAVLFLHGFLGDGRDWREVVNLVSADFFCIVIDLPGHGFSNDLSLLNDVWDFHSLTQRLLELLTYLSVKKVNITGYSLGGRLALHFALHFTENVKKIILESSSPGIKDKDQRVSRLQNDISLADQLQNSPLENFLDSWYEQTVFYGIKQHPKYVDLINSKLKNNPKLLAKALTSYSVGRQSYLGEKLSKLKVPLLLICGENDAKYVEIMQSIKHKNKSLNVLIVKECSHNVHFQKPVLFAEHLVEFLSL
jgi:2-succinyl-6-hydroxy-2,4-cyclohexadiene-1-carboxylate synthase